MSSLESQFATVTTVSADDRMRIVQQGQSRNTFVSVIAEKVINLESELPLTTSMDDADLVRVIDGSSKNITFDNFADDVIAKIVFPTPPAADTLQEFRSTSVDDTVTISDQVVFVDTSSSDVNIALPLAADSITGTRSYIYTLIKSSANNAVLINPLTPSLIDNETQLVLNGIDGHVRIVCDGVNYWTA